MIRKYLKFQSNNSDWKSSYWRHQKLLKKSKKNWIYSLSKHKLIRKSFLKFHSSETFQKHLILKCRITLHSQKKTFKYQFSTGILEKHQVFHYKMLWRKFPTWQKNFKFPITINIINKRENCKMSFFFLKS